jgi:hypothetical protein
MKQKGLLRTIRQITGEFKLDTSNYFDDFFIFYLHRKLLRISEGVYLATAHIRDTEPLKNKIRESAVKLVNLSVRIKRMKTSETDVVLYNELVTETANQLALLEITAVSGIMNESNYFLLNNELSAVFEGIIEKLKNYNHISTAVTPSFFDIGLESSSQSKHDKSDKGQIIKDTVSGKKSDFGMIKDKTVELANKSPNIVLTNENKDDSKLKDKAGKGQVKGRGGQKNILRTIERADRAKSITNFLKDNKQMTVKDIAILLPQYSEKVIQRELCKLVEKGVVARKGKKRWTSYSSA